MMLREELPLGGGVYGLWAADKQTLYIGCTNNLRHRCAAHLPAILLGCDFEVVLSLPDASRKERMRWEDRAIVAMRARGVRVANRTNSEYCGANLNAGRTHEERRECARNAQKHVTPEQRRENGRNGAQALWSSLSPEARAQRTANTRKGQTRVGKLRRVSAMLHARGLHEQADAVLKALAI